MNTRSHWEAVYSAKSAESVSWFRPHLEISLGLIERSVSGHSASIIDVGGGESTLVDDLLARGYRNITVLDISETALEVTQKRLGPIAKNVQWLLADVTQIGVLADTYDVWHDRAVFHFLTKREHRAAYIRNVIACVRPGGYVIVSTFGPEGPTKCSGLDVSRYDAESLHDQFGNYFRLLSSRIEEHSTPSGVI